MVDRVDAVAVRGRWVRHVPAGGDPLYRPPQPGSGRWQHGGVVEGFYLAEHPTTAWAEWYRALNELAVAPMRQVPRDRWIHEVEIPRLADLSGAGRLRRVGLDAPMPERSQRPAYQAVGGALWRDGWAGVISASAARPASKALCVFRRSPEVPGVTPIPPPARHDDPPAPPRGLPT